MRQFKDEGKIVVCSGGLFLELLNNKRAWEEVRVITSCKIF
jgi:hypothetical protein